jgi:hypothetical protein
MHGLRLPCSHAEAVVNNLGGHHAPDHRRLYTAWQSKHELLADFGDLVSKR